MNTAIARIGTLCCSIAVVALGPGCRNLDITRENTVYQEVFYLTNRGEKPSADPGKRFNGERGVPAYGVAMVELDADDAFTPYATAQENYILVQAAHIPSENVQQVLKEDEDLFLRQLRSYSSNGKQPEELLIYLHGFKKDFARSLNNAAKLRHELAFPGPVIAFSWPSNNSYTRYLSDMENVDWSEPLLRDLIRLVAENLPGTKIHIIAHSLGNRAVFKSVTRLGEDPEFLASWPIGDLVFMAPDYDKARFVEETAIQLQKLPSRMSLYVSARDFPLMTAAQVFLYPRLGDSRESVPILDRIETIDVSDAITITSGHGYYEESPITIEDLYHLINEGKSASERPNMKEVSSPQGTYWRLQPEQDEAAGKSN